MCWPLNSSRRLSALEAKPSTLQPRSPEAEARAAAHDAKGKADAEADLAFKLHQAGLVTRKQLARSVRAREEAQARGCEMNP